MQRYMAAARGPTRPTKVTQRCPVNVASSLIIYPLVVGENPGFRQAIVHSLFIAWSIMGVLGDTGHDAQYQDVVEL
jgi:hypothetical protein